MTERLASDKSAENFLMIIEDVFTAKGRGTAVTGRVASGKLRKGDQIQITAVDKKPISTTVVAFLGFIKHADSFVARAGDTCGILLSEVKAEQLERGMLVTTIPIL